MNQYAKRLIEVDLPIKRISAHARREKDMRLGPVPQMYIWPANKPQAACRAVICSSLWFDPVDEACPEDFRNTASDAMRRWGRDCRHLMSAESYKRFELANKNPDQYKDNEILRFLLLDFIADFANWDNSTNELYLEMGRRLTDAAHSAGRVELKTRPLLVDPFAGGGTIPLEALRIGADAIASDLNPVAVLINKVLNEYIPKYGTRLAEEVRNWGVWVDKFAKAELGKFYPVDQNGAIPIAYLWARTVRCEGPACGAEIPLMQSLGLARKGSRSKGLKFVVDREKKTIDFEVVENILASEIRVGTVKKGSATCPVCDFTTPSSSVRVQLKSRRGGGDDARLFCVVTSNPGEQGRKYRLPDSNDYRALGDVALALAQKSETKLGGVSFVPDEPTPLGGGSGAGRAFSQRNYGLDNWRDLFTQRQLLALGTYAQSIPLYVKASNIEDPLFADAVSTTLTLAINKLADLNSALCVWQLNTPNAAHVFGRWALSVVFNFAEVNPLAGAGGSPVSVVRRLANTIEHLSQIGLNQGTVAAADATHSPLADDLADLFVTDPPYYDAVPYSDISDFFYVWSKRSVPASLSHLFHNELAPKDEECILDEMKGKDRESFEASMTEALAEGRRILKPEGIGVVVFAHKSTAGWEALLQAMVDSGWIITASWPIDTEMASRLRAKNSAALASSVYLICRPRENPDGTVRNDEVGDWREVLRALPIRIREWMPRLASEGVVGADAIFACLGPALEIFSRYSSVEKPNGEQVKLGEYLEYVWAAVAKEALDMIFAGADATGFEEDARLSAMWMWTLFAGLNGSDEMESDAEAAEAEAEESSGKAPKLKGFVLEYDAARKIAQGLGAHLEDLTSIVRVKGDKATLLSVSERARDLFGHEESSVTEGKRKRKGQTGLFDADDDTGTGTSLGVQGAPEAGSTTLDRIHQTMLLFGAGRSEAVRRFLVDDGVGNDERFWRLANALSALYPSGTDEKRWVDGVLARKKGLGF